MISETDAIAILLVLTQCLMFVVGLIFLISGLDDLFIDLYFTVRSNYRNYFVLPKYAPMTEDNLRNTPEQPLAVLIPAWDEFAVIRPMLENTLRSLEYANYTIFVGTYPNDPQTQLEVEKVREKHKNVQRIVCPHDGPTNKADCLNWVYQGIKLYEKNKGINFQIFVMQDCEDVIHPLCYKLFNYLIPRKDMVQLPVQSLTGKWYKFTAGHYLDEFAQAHYKDMVVREALNHSIPAAGVGCAFSRRAFDTVAGSNNNQLFSINSLTEDYDFGFRLKVHGLSQIFVRFATTRLVMRKNFWSRKSRLVPTKEMVCVREYFPAAFGAAVRQKSRWVIGIALQGWANLGWAWDGGTKYMLFRDRKALITNLANMLGYLVLLIVVSLWLISWISPDAYRYPPLLEEGGFLWYLLLINGAFFMLRVFLRGFCVQRLYGWREAFLSVPRMAWGNVINFMATCRAIKLYSRYLRTGKLIAWDKTTHHYPSENELLSYRRKLGDLLLDARVITVEQLNSALQQQRQKQERLGKILEEMGCLSEEDIENALSRQ
ncbi:glycosyl transferase family protein [Paraherbaspirillum soli]|uniref:Glycosyl transferase family protein n=1 Tax=Paraherbaspirillum soli TaxID=631222 RepID=A0ABW0M6Q7_9BURK